MPGNNDHVPEICRKISGEMDSDKMSELVRQLNQELEDGSGKKDSESIPEPKRKIARSA
jgi:hypothetical protein